MERRVIRQQEKKVSQKVILRSLVVCLFQSQYQPLNALNVLYSITQEFMENPCEEPAAFITLPSSKCPTLNSAQNPNSSNVANKIISIINGFPKDKEVIQQGIHNLAIPKNFIDIDFIQTRSQEELMRVLSAVVTLKKQISKIVALRSHKQIIPGSSANIDFQSHQPNREDCKSMRSKEQNKQNVTYESISKPKRTFNFLKKEMDVNKKVKQEILNELQCREKIELKMGKLHEKEQKKQELLQKKKEAAKVLNKKASEVFEKQKEKAQHEFTSITHSAFLKSRQFDAPRVSKSVNATKRNNFQHQKVHHQNLKSRAQQLKMEYIQNLQNQEAKRYFKEISYRKKKQQEEDLIRECQQIRNIKSQKIRERKLHTNEFEENQKLNNFFKKERKKRSLNSENTCKGNRASDPSATSTNFNKTESCGFRNSGVNFLNSFAFQNSPSLLYEDCDQREAEILKNLETKHLKKQALLDAKVQKLRRFHKNQESKIQRFKQVQLNKILTENCQSRESQVTQEMRNSLCCGNQEKKSSNRPTNEHKSLQKQERVIRQQHQRYMKMEKCQESIIRLRKMPKSELQSKLKQFKTQQINDLFAKGIIQFLK